MILSINNQTLLFLICALFGFTAGFFYDLLKVFRKVIKHKKIFVQIEDFFYWTISSVILFFIMLEKNFGEIRVFLILGAFIGMVLYFLLISGIFISISDKVLHFTKKVFLFIFKIFFAPISYVLRFLKNIFLFFKKFIKKRLNFLKRLKKTNKLNK